MKFKFLEGKNKRYFVKMQDIKSRDDLQVQEIVRGVLTRTEYMPFVKGTFDKHISYSYLFNDFIFPYQFWGDVKNKLLTVPSLIKNEDVLLENDPKETGLFKQISREDFDEWLHSIKIPEDLSIDKKEYSYQQDSAFLAINNRISRISVATSGGKTFLTYIYCKCLVDYVKITGKILIIVPSVLLCKQLKSDFEHYDSLNETKLLVETIYSGSKKVANANIVCGTYQSLSNYDIDYFDEFSCCICDELHRSKAYSIKNNIYGKIRNADYYFGMTGTFPDIKTLDYIHIVSMFGEEVVNVSVRQLIDNKVANNVDIKSIIIDYYIDNPKTDENHVVKFDDIMNRFGELCPDYEIPDDIEENLSKKYYAEKHYFQSNMHRNAIIAKLINQFEENSIIFTDTVQYCEELYDYLTKKCPDRKFAIIHGSVKNREQYIEEMKSCESKYVLIATYGTMSTGVSIKNLTNAYIVDGGKSEIRIKQSLGRLMRIIDNKHTSKIFDFYDNLYKSSFRNQSRARLSIYKQEKLNIEKFNVKILI